MVPKTLSLAPWRVCLPLCLFLSSGRHVTPSRDVTTTQVNTMGTRRSRVCVLKHMTPKTLWKWLLPATLSLFTRLKSKFERLDSSPPPVFYFLPSCGRNLLQAANASKPHSCRPKLSAHLQLRASWFASSAPPTERLLFFFFFSLPFELI